MNKTILLFFLTVILFASCSKPAPDAAWEKGLDKLKEEKSKELLRRLKISGKTVLDRGNRPADTLLYDSIKITDQKFKTLYAILESKEIKNAKLLQDSTNACMREFDYLIKELVEKKPIAALDSFSFLKFHNETIRIIEESIPEKYLSAYRQSLILEVMQLESVILSKKSEKLMDAIDNIGSSRFVVISNKNNIREGETFKARIVCITSLPVKDKLTIDGKEYQPDSSGIVDYIILPKISFKDNEQFKKQCVSIAYSMKNYRGVDTVFTSEHCYTIQRKCSK